MASRMNDCRAASRSMSMLGGESSAESPARAAYAEPAMPGVICPIRTTASPSVVNGGRTSSEMSSSRPTTPISGVGAMAPPGYSL